MSRSYNTLKGFGLLRVRSPLLAESLLISVPGLLRWFTSPSMTLPDYFIHLRSALMCGLPHSAIRGYNGYVLLTPAFRSLSRPSSSYSSLGIRHKPVFAWPYYYFRFQSAITASLVPFYSSLDYRILAVLKTTFTKKFSSWYCFILP